MKTVEERFNNLTIRQKSKLVTTYGKTIHFTDYNEYRITLYEIEDGADSILVEVWYEMFIKDITIIRAPTYDQLDIHLHTINVNL